MNTFSDHESLALRAPEARKEWGDDGMGLISLADFLRLYRTPRSTENPAIEDIAALRRIRQSAGVAFPLVHTQAVLTHIIKEEADGDFHFYVETEATMNRPDTPMATCEIQGLAIPAHPDDPRIPQFKALAGERVELTGLFRCWPEHLRDSTQPHLFELHPVVSIGLAGAAAIDFHDLVVWPTGEDPNEPSRSFTRAFGAPNQLRLQRRNRRVVLATPTHNMKKENYVHVDAYCVGAVAGSGDWSVATLADRVGGRLTVKALALRGTPAVDAVAAMEDGVRYRVAGLCGLDVDALLASPPVWRAQLCPVLNVERLS